MKVGIDKALDSEAASCGNSAARNVCQPQMYQGERDHRRGVLPASCHMKDDTASAYLHAVVLPVCCVQDGVGCYCNTANPFKLSESSAASFADLGQIVAIPRKHLPSTNPSHA
jgi:hypothetical protein